MRVLDVCLIRGPEDPEVSIWQPWNVRAFHAHIELEAGTVRESGLGRHHMNRNSMKPLPVEGPFDSAALSYVLHCLRGPQQNKSVAIRHIADVLTADAE